MTDAPRHWSFPAELQPDPAQLDFELAPVLDAVVSLRAEVPDDAFTASILGTERSGNGIVIREDGLVLTIGYLVTEAESVWLTTNGGRLVAATPLAYDFVTGFGLVQPLGRLDVPALARGTSGGCAVGDDVLVIGHGGRHHALRADIVAKREFAGYWEYVLDEAIFTAPAHPQWSGAALVGMDGKLVGVGSLLVEEAVDGRQVQGNMVVPIDLLAPILEGMTRLGRPDRAARPWLGLYAAESDGQLVVGGLATHGPADKAGVKLGDLVVEVAGGRVNNLAQMFRKVWALGQAGVEVPLTLAREGSLVRVRVRSADRNDFMRKPQLH
jgi:S1-C subfamily serine protease